MSLTLPRQLVVTYGGPNALASAPMAASTTIYQGAIVTDSGGNAIPATSGGIETAPEQFLGIALETITNSGAAGAARVKLIAQGVLKRQTVAGASTVDDQGKKVYASDDGTLTLSSGATVDLTDYFYPLIGKIDRFDADTATFRVFFSANQRHLA